MSEATGRCGCHRTKCYLEPEDTRHGTPNGYVNCKCGCQRCTDAYAQYREWRVARNKDQLGIVTEILTRHRRSKSPYRCACSAVVDSSAGGHASHVAALVLKAIKQPKYEPTGRTLCTPPTLQTIRVHRAMGEELCNSCARLLEDILREAPAKIS